MIKAYLYGTPNGFDLYGADQELRNYFLGFYISSRKGSRLMVDRRQDGKTFYNFLKYELIESIGRPNSFFGMSVVIDDGVYTPELKKFQQWCDYIFSEVVKRGELFHSTPEGKLQYTAQRFSDKNDAAQFIIQNLPKIFSEGNKLTLQRYDNSFSWENIGKVVGLSTAENDETILTAFRMVPNIVLDGNIKKETFHELNLSELDEAFTKLSRSITEEVGFNPDREKLPVLEKLYNKMVHHVKEINDYKPHAATEERKQCNDLYNSFAKAANNLGTAINTLRKPASAPKTPQPSLHTCIRCKQAKPVAQFSKTTPTLCLDCERKTNDPHVQQKYCNGCKANKPITEFYRTTDKYCKSCTDKGLNNNTRLCRKCNRVLSLSHFKGQSEYCAECLGHGTGGSGTPKWMKLILPAIAAAAIIVGAILLLKPKSSTTDDNVTITQLLEQQKWDEAYKAADSDEEKLKEVRETVNNHLRSFLLDENQYFGASDRWKKFKENNPNVCEDEVVSTWKDVVGNWAAVMQYIKGEGGQYTQNGYQQKAQEALPSLIDNLRTLGQDVYANELKNRYEDVTGKSEIHIIQTIFKYTDIRGELREINSGTYFNILKGTPIAIQSQGKIRIEDGTTSPRPLLEQGSDRMTYTPQKKIVIVYNNDKTITFDPKPGQTVPTKLKSSTTEPGKKQTTTESTIIKDQEPPQKYGGQVTESNSQKDQQKP